MTDTAEQQAAAESAEAGAQGSAPGDEEQHIEQTPGDGTGDEQGAAPADDGAGAPRKKGVERRIGQLTRRYRESERQRLALKEQVEKLEQRIGPAPEPARPRQDDFETPEEYEDALLSWHDDMRAHKQGQDSSEQSATVDGAADIVTEFEEQLEAVAPDAIMVVMDDDWPCSDAMVEFIRESDKGAQLAYHLASNTSIADKLSKLSPSQAARELVKIEAELPATIQTSAGDEAGKAAGGAPPPIEPGKTGGGEGGITDPDKMSTEQWLKWRKEQLTSQHSR